MLVIALVAMILSLLVDHGTHAQIFDLALAHPAGTSSLDALTNAASANKEALRRHDLIVQPYPGIFVHNETTGQIGFTSDLWQIDATALKIALYFIEDAAIKTHLLAIGQAIHNIESGSAEFHNTNAACTWSAVGPGIDGNEDGVATKEPTRAELVECAKAIYAIEVIIKPEITANLFALQTSLESLNKSVVAETERVTTLYPLVDQREDEWWIKWFPRQLINAVRQLPVRIVALIHHRAAQALNGALSDLTKAASRAGGNDARVDGDVVREEL